MPNIRGKPARLFSTVRTNYVDLNELIKDVGLKITLFSNCHNDYLYLKNRNEWSAFRGKSSKIDALITISNELEIINIEQSAAC